MAKVKVGVIGLGGISQLAHLPVLAKLSNVEITAVSDIKKTQLKNIADKFGIEKRFTDYREMLESVPLDAVIITTPTDTHYQIAIDSLNAGKHVFVEKPVTRTFNEALEIRKKASEKGKLVMVGMNMRFRPDAMLMKSLLGSKELGEIFYIRASWIHKRSSSANWLMAKEKAGGGVLMDLGVLLIDLAVWLLGYPKVEKVSVENFKHRTKSVEDSSVGMLRLSKNLILSFEVSWSLNSEKDKLELDFFGTKGTAHLNPLRAYKIIGEEKVDITPFAPKAKPSQIYLKSFENELKHFIAATQNLIGIVSSIDGALHRMKLMEAMYNSAKSHKELNYTEPKF